MSRDEGGRIPGHEASGDELANSLVPTGQVEVE